MKLIPVRTWSLLFLLLLGACTGGEEKEDYSREEVRLQEKLENARSLTDISPLISNQLAKEVLSESKALKRSNIVAEAQLILCTYTTFPESIDSTIQYCEAALSYFAAERDALKQGMLFNSMGVLADIKGDKGQAVEYFEQAEKLLKAANNNFWLGEVYNNWGVVYVTENSLEKALLFYIKALEVNESSGNKKALIASHNNLGRLYYKQRLYADALEHALKSNELARATNSATWLPLSLNLLGDVYAKTGRQENAIVSYEEALALATENEDDYNLIFTLNRLARIHERKGDKKKALNYIHRSLIRARITGKRKDLEEIYLILGACNRGLGNYRIAKSFIDTAYHLAQDNQDYKYLLEAYKQYGALYQHFNDYKMSLSFLERYQALNDTLREIENAELLSRLEREFLNKEQAKEIFELKQKASDQNLFLIVLLGIFIIVVIISYSLLIYSRKVKKLSDELEIKVEERTNELAQSNIHLERFAYIASHDLKTPLRTISSFLSLIKRRIKPYNNPELEDLLSFASNGAKQMNNLIEDVLEFSKINTTEMRQEEVHLDKTLQSVLYNIGGFLEEKEGKVEYGNLPVIKGNPGYLHQLFQNLIVNGIKYNKNTQPEVYIDCQLKNSSYQFMVKDNGIGIDEEYREMIFEMFKRLHTSDKYEGTGIGLALCKKIVEQHGGRIWVEKSDENGSCFCFTLSSDIAETTPEV